MTPSSPAKPSSPVNLVHGARYFSLRGPADKERYDALVRLLAANPAMKAETAAVEIGAHRSAIEHAIAAARETLGIAAGDVNDRPRYLAACSALGVTPAEKAAPVVLVTPLTDMLRSSGIDIDTGFIATVADSNRAVHLEVLNAAPWPWTGADLTRLRSGYAMSQRDMARLLGVNQSVVSKAESRKRDDLPAGLDEALRRHAQGLPVLPVLPVKADVSPAKPVEAKPVEAKPVEAKPVEAKPVPTVDTLNLLPNDSDATPGSSRRWTIQGSGRHGQQVAAPPAVPAIPATVRDIVTQLRAAMAREGIETLGINLSTSEPATFTLPPETGAVTRRVLVTEAI